MADVCWAKDSPRIPYFPLGGSHNSEKPCFARIRTEARLHYLPRRDLLITKPYVSSPICSYFSRFWPSFEHILRLSEISDNCGKRMRLDQTEPSC